MEELTKKGYTNYAFIYPEYKEIVQKNYENTILKIMNASRDVFPLKEYFHQEKQSNGESDFYAYRQGACEKEKVHYEAKQLFSSDVCRMVHYGNDLTEWINIMLDEHNELAEAILKRGSESIKTSKIYKRLAKEIDKLEKDENGILYVPFPLFTPRGTGVHSRFAIDEIDELYKAYSEDHPQLKEKSIVIIYLSEDGKVVLREFGTHKQECLNTDAFYENVVRFATI